MTLIRSILTAAFVLVSAAFAAITPATAGARTKCDPCDRLERIERKLDSLTARRHLRRPPARAHKARAYTARTLAPAYTQEAGCVQLEWTTRARDGRWYPARACVYPRYIEGITLAACNHLSGDYRYPDINEQILVDGRWVLYRTY